MYVGRLHIGVPWSEIERELTNLPAWTMKMEASTATMLQRGKYMYTFASVTGKLHTIAILSTNYEHWEKLKGFSDEERRRFITPMFKNNFDLNLEKELEKYR